MRTDDLIRLSTTDMARPQPLLRVLVVGLVPSLVIAGLVVWQALGFRVDLAASVTRPLSVLRLLLTCGLAALALFSAQRLARPEGRGLARAWQIGIVPAGAIALLLWAYLFTPPEARQMAVVGKTMLTCLTMIPLLSILPATAILMTLRQGATTAP
jgi:hypothetical protein